MVNEMNKRKSNRVNNNDYLKGLEESQEHQYDQRYYVVGKMPPFVESLGNSKLIGWAMVIIALIYFLSFAIVAIQLADIDNTFPVIMFFTFFGVCLIQFAVGMILIRRGMDNTKYKRLIKRLFAISLLGIFLFGICVTINIMFFTKSAVLKIDNSEVLRIYQVNDKNYVVIDNKLTLRCKFSDYLKIWSFKLDDPEATFNIGYKWNVLTPNKGVIQKLEMIK